MDNKIFVAKVSLRLEDGFKDLARQFGSGLMISAGLAPEVRQQPFLATVTYAGIASDGAVGGTEDIDGGPYRILIPPDLLAARAGDLIGKGVFAAATLDTHANSTRVGDWYDAYPERIIGTEIHALRGGGLIDKRACEGIQDGFMAKILDRARNGELGFSYDLKDAPGHLEDASNYPGGSRFDGEKILVLDDFKWRGATILRRETAAYSWTSLAAQRVAERVATAQPAHAARATSLPASAATSTARADNNQTTPEENEVDETKLKALLAEALTAQSNGLKTDLKTQIDAAIAPIDARLTALEAKGAPVQQQQVAERVATAQPAPAARATSFSVKDLIAGMKDAIKDGLKEAGFEKQTPGQGQRATFSAAQIDTVRKYAGDAIGDDDDPTSLTSINQAIATVQAGVAAHRFTKDHAARAIQNLRAMKKQAMALEAEPGVN